MDLGRHDIVLYGATGRDLQHVPLIVANSFDESTLSAMAKQAKVIINVVGPRKQAIDELPGRDLQHVPLIVANSFDESTLSAMAKQAKVIINVVGPYRLYGEPVVRAAVENGASYVDISGEPAFLESMQMKYSELAREKGLYVVGACGWDSIPCDLGVNFLKNKFDGQLNHGYSFNAGTYRTLVLGMANMHTDGLGKIRRSIMPEKLPRSSFRPQKRGTLWYNEKIGGWCLPFYGSDKSVVTRSQYFDYKLHNVLPVSKILLVQYKRKTNICPQFLFVIY
ncbi:unnamed protein product [Gongylonema pulchrum]|uniref:Sacchrp_dh_NADP domain-containing protein n=1 Tax=Gongylonema pulchrum TaxID=637853 RepID=A0A183E5H6_9BILA|nr:unnamed protein product [Gongylonema pulchrum]